MKELSIEEKAKRYDEIIEKTNKMHSENCEACQMCIEELIPELKESEDERVRKFLIGYFDKLIDENSEWGLTKETREKIITWLEKQGDYNRLVKEIKECKELFSKEKGKAISINDKLSLGGRIVMLEELLAFTKEKQDEHKPADKVEPKFHEGDWVVTNYSKVNQVVSVDKDGDGYTLDDGVYFSGSWCDMYHLWTIQDAKDGDVLATDDCNICVFDGTVEDGKYPFAYYGLIRCKFGSYDRKLPFTHDSIHPATKEQRDLLFRKMKEAGYEWDAENKQLKKIEQKPSGWSDEDEKMIDDIIETASHHCYLSITNINWLKSLKDRFCPQKHWKPTEEQIGALEHLIDSTILSHTFMLKELVKQLKAL